MSAHKQKKYTVQHSKTPLMVPECHGCSDGPALLPDSLSMFRFMSSSVTRAAVTVMNSPVAQTPSYGVWLAASSISRQYTSARAPFSGDKRPHPCHRAVAAIDYHHSFSLSSLPRPSSVSLSFHFSFSSHAFPLSI